MNRIKMVLMAGLTVVTLASCGGDKKQDTTAPEATTESTDTTTAPDEDVVNISIESNDAMQYNLSEIKVPKGKKVILTLRHTGTQPKEAMGHNWVLLKQGTDLKAFAEDAATQKDNDYIPTDAMKDAIIAHTKVIGGGQADRIEFTIDEAGTYDYICTFPAHYQIMHGKLIVE